MKKKIKKKKIVKEKELMLQPGMLGITDLERTYFANGSFLWNLEVLPHGHQAA